MNENKDYNEYEIKDSLLNTIDHLRVCKSCGCLVVDWVTHQDFHKFKMNEELKGI